MRITLIVLHLLIPILVNAQTSVDFQNLNYIREITVVKSGTTTWIQADQLSVGDKFQSTTYLDGLGRPIQKVDKGTSVVNNIVKDVVIPIGYNESGSEMRSYLPYVTATDIGKFKNDAVNLQSQYFNSVFGETPGYGLTQYEASPLNRVVKTMLPGNNWAGSNTGKSSEYDINSGNEKVHSWQIDFTAGAYPISSSLSTYSSGLLFKNIAADENGKKIINYTDKGGNIILRKVQLSNAPGIEHDGWLCTYYVYDDFGRQRFVIPPKAVVYLDSHNWVLSADVINELCFSYEYDKRGRVIVKKSPGAEPISMVYDKRDRLVFTQDGNQSFQNPKKWMVSLYDNLDRLALTGLMDYNLTRDDLQDWVDNNTTNNGDINNISVTSSIPNQANLVIAQRIIPPAPDPGYKAANSITFNAGFISEDGANFVAQIDPSSQSVNNAIGINNNPLPANNNLYTLTLTFYDNYSYAGVKTFDNNFTIDNSLAANENQAVLQSQQTLGYVTGTKVRLLDGGNTFLTTTSFYDHKGRAIQLQGENHKGVTEQTTTQYDFSGKMRSTYELHKFDAGNQTIVFTRNTFDVIGRLTKISKSINGSPEKDIAAYSYNELGQLANKTLAPGFSGEDGPQLESLDYEYNIHGWLLGINKAYSTSSTREGHFFGMELGYDKTGAPSFTNLQKNGNIAGNAWKTKGDNIKRKYDYNYDNANQLTNADFNQQNTTGAGWTKDKVNFTSGYTYDENGNIKTQNQWGSVPGLAPLQIDQLVYHYDMVSGEWTNRLSRIEEQTAVVANGKLGDFKNGTAGSSIQQYDYDKNANLLKDLNKEIGDAATSGIQYNFMDLPTLITFKNTNKTIAFIYDAAGNKLRKILDEPAVGNIPTRHVETDYDENFVYETIPANLGGTALPELQYFGHEEGRVRKSATGIFVYDYFIKDHLTNVRMILTEEQQQDIYPAVTLEGNAQQTQTGDPLAIESKYYTIDEGNIKPNSEAIGITSYPNTNVTPPNNNPNCNNTSFIKDVDNSQRVYRLNSSIAKSGLGITLKVMSGDKIDIAGKSYYFQNNTGGNSANQLITNAADIISGLLGTPKGVTAGKTNLVDLQGNNSITGAILSFLNKPNRNDPSNSQKPRAAINWILLNEQFEYVDGNFSPVGNQNVVKDHFIEDPQLHNIPVTKNGYLYVYVSNESPVNVYFDNLQVVHTRGRVLEENHYYSYGLKIAGISSKAAGDLQNKAGYQGSFSENDEETALDEFDLRHYDPQIGRWTTTDPYEQFSSPYIGIGNNPVKNVDPDGGWIFSEVGLIEHGAWAIGGVAAGALIWGSTHHWNSNSIIQGAEVGGGIGLGLSFVSWENMGKWVGHFFENNTLWMYYVGNTVLGTWETYRKNEIHTDITGYSINRDGSSNRDKPNTKRRPNPGADLIITTQLVRGKLTFTDDGVDYSFDANSGPDGNGAIPDGDYTMGKLKDRKDSRFRFDNALADEGFTIDLTPDDKSVTRTVIEAHPADSRTHGCIGITGKDKQIQFYNLYPGLFNKYKRIKLKATNINGTKLSIIREDKHGNLFDNKNNPVVQIQKDN